MPPYKHSSLLEEYYFKLRIIGIYQIIGGVIGLSTSVWLYTMLDSKPTAIVMLFYVYNLVYIFSLATGIGLITHKEKSIVPSLLLNIPQLLYFFFNAYSFKISTGFPLYIIFDLTGIKVNLKMGYPSVRITWWDTTELKTIGINLMAIVMIYFLLKLKAQIKREKRVMVQDLNSSEPYH